MRELPLLLTADNLRLTIEGIKTQMRQLIKNLPPYYVMGNKPASYGNYDYAFLDMADPIGTYPTWVEARYHVSDHCWLKEAWTVVDVDADEDIAIHYPLNDKVVWYKEKAHLLKRKYDVDRKRSPRFMFKAFARYWVEITRVIDPHRIQSISEEDAKAEGAEEMFRMDAAKFIRGASITEVTYRNGFRHIWEEIHGPGAWERNEWVFGDEYRMIEK